MPVEIDDCQYVRHAEAMAATALPTPAVPSAPGGGQSTLGGQATSIGRASPSAALAACCTPLTRAPLSAPDAERLATVLKAIAVPARLRLLSLIHAAEGGEICACELNEPLGLSQPTVSHHLKVLVDAGLISRDKRGVWAYYRVIPASLDALRAVFGGTD